MENCYAVRVSYPYVWVADYDEGVHARQSVRSIVNAWSTQVERMVVYEHDDDGANRIHCHLMIEGSRVSKKRLQQLASAACDTQVDGGEDRRARSLMSFRSKGYDGNIAGFSYCTKGKYDPKYIQGWTAENALQWKEAWVAPEHHVKRTPWRILQEAFYEWWNDKSNRLDYDTVITHEIISRRVFHFLLHKHGGIYPPQARTERWFLITNACHAYQVSFPEINLRQW